MSLCEGLSQLVEETEAKHIVSTSDAVAALRIRDALNGHNVSVDTVARLAQAEPLLAARIVAIANSITYSRGVPLTNLRSAIVRVGFSTVRTIATAIVARSMAGPPRDPGHSRLAQQLWLHTAQVSALANVIARRITHQDPEAALFAGVVHEIGTFFLLSRVSDFSDILHGDPNRPDSDCEAIVGRALLGTLSIPGSIQDAIETIWSGYLSFPPVSLGDTLLLADQLAPTASPIENLPGTNDGLDRGTIDGIFDEATLSSILSESELEVASLCAALTI